MGLWKKNKKIIQTKSRWLKKKVTFKFSLKNRDESKKS